MLNTGESYARFLLLQILVLPTNRGRRTMCCGKVLVPLSFALVFGRIAIRNISPEDMQICGIYQPPKHVQWPIACHMRFVFPMRNYFLLL